ncbi:MAG: T9SS C-terminal target domain-containing protein, partial [Ignavibacteriales bacterium]|nr:T9SS C-terminal target domain-containing protein [Ignavibacteriales bacterium]
MLKRLSLLLVCFVFGISIYAQTPAVDIPLTVTDGSATTILRFGLDPAATDGIDPAIGEQTLPPLP